MASRTIQAVRDACAMASEARTEEHIDDVLNFVKDVKFFTKLTPPQQRALCRTMTIETFEPRQFIFQIGEYGNKFYIILTGSVGVQCPTTSAPCPRGLHATGKCDCPDRPLETLVFLDKGLGFGELALQSNAPRSASILTSELTEVLVTTKEDYDCHAGQRHKAFLDQRVDFLRSCPGVERSLREKLFTMQDVIQMANCLNEQSLSGNCLVCKQNESADRVIFVRSGSLAVLRTMEIDQSTSRNSGAYSTTNSMSPRKSLTLAAQQAAIAAAAQGSKNWTKQMLEVKKAERNQRRSEIAHEQQRLKEEAERMEEEKANKEEEASRNSVTFDEEDTVANMLPDTEETAGGKKGPKPLWAKVRMATRLWAGTNAIAKANDKKAETKKEKGEDFDSVAAAQESIDHFMDVQKARRLVNNFEEKRLKDKTAKYKDKLRERSSNMMKKDADWKSMMRKLTVDRFQRANSRVSGLENQDQEDDRNSLQSFHRRLQQRRKPVEMKKSIINVGSIGPFQYYGDQQVLMNTSYPVSLLSDPVAEVYVMSKNDIMRRLPKKIIMSFFCSDEGDFPKDEALVGMVHQTERWEAFRHDVWSDAYGARKMGFTVNGIPRSLRDPSVSRIGCDVNANREFVGLNKPSHIVDAEDGELNVQRVLGSHCRKPVLTHKDSEYFSGSSAKFLSRMTGLENDRGLVQKLSQDGTKEFSFRKHEEDWDSPSEKDPFSFRTDKFWSKLQKDPLKELFEEEFSLEALELKHTTEGFSGSSTQQTTHANKDIQQSSQGLAKEARKTIQQQSQGKLSTGIKAVHDETSELSFNQPVHNIS